MKREETAIDKIANDWVKHLTERSPSYATYLGFPGGEQDVDDFSPDSLKQDRDDHASLITRLNQQQPQDEVDVVTKEAMIADADLNIRTYDSGLLFRNMNNIASPAQDIRDIFDLSPTETVEHWENLGARMSKVPQAIAGYIESLRVGIKNCDTPAKRQVEEIITQAAQINSPDGFFREFSRAEGKNLPDSLRKELAAAGEKATEGYRTFFAFT